MTVHTGTNPATLTQLAADIHQLTQPIHMAHRRQVITHPPLLDQLREAATPASSQQTGGRRTIPGSRPPARLDAIDADAEIQVEISRWQNILGIGAPDRSVDYQKAVLNRMAEAAPTIASSLAEGLAVAVHDWWRLAATASGWRPADLLKLR